MGPQQAVEGRRAGASSVRDVHKHTSGYCEASLAEQVNLVFVVVERNVTYKWVVL